MCNFRFVAFDEARGLEDPRSKSVEHLQLLRDACETKSLPFFVLAISGAHAVT